MKDPTTDKDDLSEFEEIKKLNNLKEDIQTLERDFRANELEEFKRLIKHKPQRSSARAHGYSQAKSVIKAEITAHRQSIRLRMSQERGIFLKNKKF